VEAGKNKKVRLGDFSPSHCAASRRNFWRVINSSSLVWNLLTTAAAVGSAAGDGAARAEAAVATAEAVPLAAAAGDYITADADAACEGWYAGAGADATCTAATSATYCC